MTELESRRGKSRRERVEFARSRDILDIANELQMELVRSGRDYRWKEHDSLVISPDKNLWKWFSRNTGGDAISLVETIKEVDFNQSVDFLNDGNFKEFQMVERPQEDFKYYLEKYEQPFSAGRDYLRNQRGLSDETIDYFLEQGVLAQANAKLNYFAEGNSGSSTNAIEPVIVFKSLSSSGEVFGASLQGIQENWEKWSKHGYAKVIMKNSDPMTGIHVDIGSPKRLIFTESPIDLMSYYELHKDSLQDVRLVSMDGLKESTIGRHLSQIKAEMSGKALIWTPEQLADGLQVAIDRHFFEDGKNADLITLALDNDKAGRTFIQELEAKGAVINSDLPGLRPGQDKTDWNDVLKSQHEEKSYSRKSEYEEMAEATLSESSHFPDTSHLSPEDATWLKENWNNISFSVQSTRPSETDPTTEEKHISGHQESIANTEEDAGRTMSYEEVKRENEALTKKLNNRIQSGELSIEFAPDFYLYDVFAKLGNSHPTKYLNDKRMEALSPIHSLLSSIDDRTVDLYKTKGTPEQDSLYQALKPHQRALGVDISTQFIGELAIAAYNTNKQLESLSSDSFGAYFGERTLDNLSQSVERMLEYPLIESGTRDFPYGFVTTPNTLFHYLEEQEGEVVLNREFLDNLMSRLDTQPIKIKEVSEEKEKSLEGGQETTNNSEQDKKNETKLRDFSEQAQEAAPLPEVSESQPLKDLSPSQTESHSLLYFTINKPEKSIYKENYHPIKPEELNKLNHHTDIIQDAAQWYLDNLSDTTIHYFYLKGDKQYNININFQQHHFMHLTGLFPIKSNQTAVKTLHDFAEGRGEYDNILVSNRGATFQKIKVLPDLKSILETESFYFDQVEDIPKLKSLSMEKAIQSEDKDIVLALSSNNENIYPASLMELTDEFRIQIKNSLHQNVILGIFQEKDGEIHKVDINKNYIEDDGERMLSVLRNKQYEEVSREFEQTTPDNTLNNPLVDSATFTQVLDTVYNLGVPGDISKTPEEFHQAWNQYLDYAKQYNDKFDQIVAVAGEDHLLDTNSDFYKEWEQDHIYKENYHVRLQWAEERPDGPKLPFKETELISYQDFARELYKANQDFYPIHQEGMRQVTAGTPEAYIPPTKIKFDIYAPGGKVIKEGIRYDVGDETTPISQMLGLGYRRLNGQSELALMDEEILSQLETREVNKEISQEANVSARLTEEVEG
ncbi:TPA: PBECR4 domain-containing protein [Streptococcus agalactiae]